jgi:hypothetical protein
MNFFVRYFVEMPLPMWMVEPALDRVPPDWLVAMARKAQTRALGLVLESDANPGDEPPGGLVEMSIEPATRHGSTSIRPIAWALVGTASAVPILEADLEVGPLGRRSTQLALSGRYFVPNLEGHPRLDRGTAQRIGEAAIKAFVDSLADTVERIAVRAPAVPPPLADAAGWPMKPGWPLKVV